MTKLRILLAALCGTPAWVFAASQIPPAQGGHLQIVDAAAVPAMMQVLPEIKGVVSWTTLAKVKQVKSKDRILPAFTNKIAALDNQEVKLQGFMMPLDPGEKQKHFLISVNPPSCAYCMPAGPEGIVEVLSKTPIKYSYEPIILSGKMAVLKNDPTGLYYRLTGAALLSKK